MAGQDEVAMMSSAEQFAQQAGVRRSGDDAESRTGAAISSVSTMFETDNDINANPRSSKKEGAPLDLDNHHYASEHLSLPHEISLIFLLSAAQLFTQASLAISIVPLLIIAPDLGMQSDGERSWATAAYSLTVGTGILLSGRWGDCWGHKRMVLVGWLWSSLFLLIGALTSYSHSQIFFDTIRALQGFGFAILLPNSIAIMGTGWREGRRKHMVFSLFGATAPSGFVVGSIVSGVFAQSARYWPGVFYFMAGMTFVLGVLGEWVIPNMREEDRRVWGWDDLDIWGSAAIVSGLILVNFAFNQGATIGWQTPYVYVLLIIGVLLIGLFFYLETIVPIPLIPISLLSKEIAWILIIIAFGWGSFGSWIFYLVQFFEIYQGITPWGVTLRMIPVAISGAIAAFTSGVLISKIGPGPILLAALVAFMVGNILLATMGGGETYWGNVFVALIVTPWGMDCSFPSANIIMSASLPRNQQGIGASLTNATLNYSISLFLGFAGLIASKVTPSGPYPTSNGTTEAEALFIGYKGAWVFSIGIAGLGVVLAAGFNLENWWKSRRGRGEGEIEKEKGMKTNGSEGEKEARV